MNLCFATLAYPTTGSASGVGTHTRAVARAMRDRGHRVTVIALVPKDSPVERDDDGIRVVGVWPSGGHWYASKLPGGAMLAPYLREREYAQAVGEAVRRLGDEQPFDIVEATETGSGFLCENRPYRAIVRLHGERYTIYRQRPEARVGAGLRWQRRLQHRAIACADVLTSPSHAHARAVEAEMGRPLDVRVIPNVIDLEPDAPNPPPPALMRTLRERGRRVILYAGRIERGKGVAPLLAVAGCLPEAHVVFAGAFHPHFPEKERNALVAEAGVGDRVTFLGRLDRTALAAWYAHADVFAMPSYYETFGNVFVEAMAHGLPVVAFDAGAAREVVGDAGVLVPPGDIAALAEALRTLLADEDCRRQLGEAGRNRVAAHYTAAAVLPRYVELYESLHRNPAPASQTQSG